MISLILDWVPAWIWYAAAAVVLLLTINLWMPAALAIWRVLPNWARWLLGGFIAVLFAYLTGRNTGRQNELDRQRERDRRAIAQRKKTDQQVEGMNDDELDKELNKWMRD